MLRPSPLAWAVVPLAIFLIVLARLWANVPLWDDYGTVLDTLSRMMDAPSPREWLGVLVAQHNEHRIYTVRLVARAVAALPGPVDFRLLVFLGNLAFVGVFVLAWAEFRESLTGPLVAAAAFVMFQWSYYEAAVWTSGGLTNMGAVFFSFAAIFVALRAGAIAAAACVLFALLATGSSASGLLVLPLAAAGCAVQKRWPRAALFAAAAAALWLAYFHGYTPPAGHPSPMAALSDPFAAAKLFLVVVGSIYPSREGAPWTGVFLLAVLAALAWKRAWKPHPVATLWVGFILLSAAAAAVGRVGFGVNYASRYAIYSTSLAVLCLMALHEITRPWRPGTTVGAVVAAAFISFAVSLGSWDGVRSLSFNGQLLAKPKPAGAQAPAASYFGLYFPNAEWATAALDAAARKGIYRAPEKAVYDTAVRFAQLPPEDASIAGHVDEVRSEGQRVIVRGWADIPATVPGRVLSVLGEEPFTSARFELVDRSDAARVIGDPRLVFSGFRIELDYPSEPAAQSAAAWLCVAVEAPSYQPQVLSRVTATCPRRSRRVPS